MTQAEISAQPAQQRPDTYDIHARTEVNQTEHVFAETLRNVTQEYEPELGVDEHGLLEEYGISVGTKCWILQEGSTEPVYVTVSKIKPTKLYQRLEVTLNGMPPGKSQMLLIEFVEAILRYKNSNDPEVVRHRVMQKLSGTRSR